LKIMRRERIRPVRVLAVGNRDPFATAGGYERIFASAVGVLRARGHEVTVATADDAFQWYWRDGDFFTPSWRERRAIEKHNELALRGLLDGIDAVSWWGMGGMSLGLIEHVRRAGVPAVGVVGDGWMVYGPKVDRPVALGPCAHWIFISRAVRERALREGYVFPSWEIAHPGVDPEVFPRAPERPWEGRLAYVGRVSPEKGVETAQAAVALLDDATLTICGPGEDPLAGYVGADAIVFPVEWPEPWGLVPLEAMSVGRPVIATGTGGSGEYLVDGENCLLFPPGDAEALASAVRRLAADAPLRARLRAGGFETAARFSQAAFDDAVVGALARVAGTGYG
jgi:glycosyltransferase involved in cell wall biosynthesis